MGMPGCASVGPAHSDECALRRKIARLAASAPEEQALYQAHRRAGSQPRGQRCAASIAVPPHLPRRRIFFAALSSSPLCRREARRGAGLRLAESKKSASEGRIGSGVQLVLQIGQRLSLPMPIESFAAPRVSPICTASSLGELLAQGHLPAEGEVLQRACVQCWIRQFSLQGEATQILGMQHRWRDATRSNGEWHGFHRGGGMGRWMFTGQTFICRVPTEISPVKA